MITLKRWRWKERRGLAPIYIVVHKDGKRSTVSTGVHVSSAHWNEDRGRVRKSHPDHVRLNGILSEAVAKADGADGSPAEITQSVRGKARRGDFIAYAEGRIEEYRRRNRYGTASAYSTPVTKLKKYAGRVSFREVTPQLLRDFHTHLVEDYKNSPSTCHKNITILRTLYYDAVKDGKAEGNPFRHLRLKKEQAISKYLSLRDIEAMHSLELDGWTAVARDMFLFAFYAGGMRISDVLMIRHEDIQPEGDRARIVYRQIKTGEPSMVLLVERGVEIIARYDWPSSGKIFPAMRETRGAEDQKRAIASATTMTNKHLKKIARLIGVPTITTHYARHSFTNAMLDGHVDMRTVSAVLGHARIQTTEGYARRLRGVAADDDMERVLSTRSQS